MAVKKTTPKRAAKSAENTPPESASVESGAGDMAGPAEIQATVEQRPDNAEQGERIAGQGLQPVTQSEIEALFVRTARQYPRRRAGFAFGPVPIGIALDALTEAQIQAIESDSFLVVERCFVSADEALG